MKRVLNCINSSSKKILSIVNKHKKKILLSIGIFIILFIPIFLYINLTNPTTINKYIAHVINKGAPANKAFKDENFYNCVVDNYNSENNPNVAYSYSLSSTQLKKIKNLSCDNKKISNVSGLNSMTSLEYVGLGNNYVNLIDASKLSSLKTFNFNYMRNPLFLSENGKSSNGRQYIKINTKTLINSKIKLPSHFILNGIRDPMNRTDFEIINNNEFNITLSSIYDTQIIVNYKNTNTNSIESVSGGYFRGYTYEEYEPSPIIMLNYDSKNISPKIYPSNDEYLNNYTIKSSCSNEDLYVHSNKIISYGSGDCVLTVNGPDSLYKIDIPIHMIKLYSSLYDIDFEKNVIYTGDHSSTELILQNLKADGNAELESDEAKYSRLSNIKLKYDNKLFRYFELIYITGLSKFTNKYNLFSDKPYIYIMQESPTSALEKITSFNYGNSKINLDETKEALVIGGEWAESPKYNINLVNITSDTYDLSKRYIYTGINDFNIKNVNTINGKLILNDDILTLKYQDTIIDTKKIITVSSNIYDLSKNYIYDLNGSFDINNITCTNCNVTLENGKVRAKYEDTILQEWDLVSINLENSLYDLSKDYIYIGTDKFDSSKIDSTNITFEEHDNLVDLKYNDEIIKSYKLVSVSSDEYDISGKMINVYSNSFDKTKISVINGTFTVANNTVTIKYDNDVLDNFKIVGLSSLKYDLTKDYILLKNDEKIDLSLINTANVTLDLKENSLDVLYEDEVIKTYKIVRYSSSKYDLTKDYIYIGTKELDVNDITVINGEVLLENNILYIKYQEDVLGSYKVIGVKSNDYSIGNDYIYTKNNSFDKTKVSVSNGNIETSSNKVIIKYENTKLDEFNIVSISSNKYDLTKEYIYLGLSKFDNSKITYTNCEGIVENDVLNIKYNNKTLDSYKLAYISSDKYNLEKEYVYTGMSGIDITKINATNLALENINNNLNIKYNDEIVDTRKIVSYSSNVYDLTKDYIYIGFNDFNKDNVNVINGVTEYSNNLLKIKYGNDILKTYEVSSISSSKYDLSKKYIYVGTENLDKTHINNINNTLEVKDGMLNVKYEDDILQSYKIVKISSSKYDLSKDNIRIYKNEEFDIKSITVENGLKEYKDDKLYIKYNDDILKVYSISTRAKGDITGDDKITIADVSLLYRHVRKTKVITDSETLEISDLTGDGKITIADVAKLYRYVRGKITEL